MEVSATGEDGFFRAVSQSFDVIILDLKLPGRSGLEILNTLRGLAIARWAVEANGGRIEVESQAGSGSVFRIVFGEALASTDVSS